MKLLLVRHAKAEEHDFSRWPDDSQRPLSQRGIEQFQRSAKRLGKLLEPDVVLVSPFVRAVHTAKILHKTAGWPEAEHVDAVARGEFAGLVNEHLGRGTGTLVLVGHEPSISSYLSQLVSRSLGATIRVRPGSAALLELESPASGELQWLAPTQIFK